MTEAAAQVAAPQGQGQGTPKGANPQGNGNPQGAKPPPAPEPSTPPGIDLEAEVDATVSGEKRKVKLKQLLRDYQKYEHAEKRLWESSQKEKELKTAEERLRQFLNTGKGNPRYLLEKVLGSPAAVKKFAEDFIWEEIQNQKKTPEQIELERYKRQEQERLDYEQADKARAAQEESQSRVAQLRDHYDKLFSEALQKSNLPKNAETVERMSKVYMSYLKNGYEPSMDEVMDDVQGSYTKDIQALLGGLSGERLYNLLGEDLWKKAREYDVSRLASPTGRPPVGSSTLAPPVMSAPKNDKMSIHDAKALWRKNAGM